MALDDFASWEEPDTAATPASEAPVVTDEEDLFDGPPDTLDPDFDPMTAAQLLGDLDDGVLPTDEELFGTADDVEALPGASDEIDPELDAAPLTVDVADATAEAAPSEPELTVADAPVASLDADFDLDEDVLDFGPLPADSTGISGLGTEIDDVLAEIGADDDLSDLGDLGDDNDLFGVSYGSKTPSASSVAARLVGAGRAAFAGSADPQLASTATPVLVGAGSSRATWIGIASVLAANFTLMFFAWSASRSLQAGLERVREDVATTQTATDVATGTETPPIEPTDAASDTPDDAVDGATDLARLPLDTFDQVALDVAQSEIDAGLYVAARTRLFELLAVIDRIDPERRRETEARAEFLLGDTYAHAAQARGAQREEQTP